MACGTPFRSPRLVFRAVTWKNDSAEVVDGRRYSGSVNINETRRVLTGVNRPDQTETVSVRGSQYR